jgi:hypothetical protein
MYIFIILSLYRCDHTFIPVTSLQCKSIYCLEFVKVFPEEYCSLVNAGNGVFSPCYLIFCMYHVRTY